MHDGIAHRLNADVLDRAAVVFGDCIEAGALQSCFFVVFAGDARGELLQRRLDAGIAVGAVQLRLLPLQHRGDGMNHVVLRVVQARQPRHQLTDGLQMRQQIVEFDDERQEVVPRQGRFLPQRLQVVLEGVCAAFDRGHAQGRGLSLDRVYLPEQRVELLAKYTFFPGGLAQHRVDHFHGGVGVVQERFQLRRIDVQNTQQGIDLTLSLVLRGLQFVREFHPGGHVRNGHQHIGHLSVDAHPVKIELQIAGVEFAAAGVQMHLHFAQWIDGLDQLLVGALGPKDFDELEGGRQGPLRHDVPEQIFKGKTGEILALEQGFQCAGISRSDL